MAKNVDTWGGIGKKKLPNPVIVLRRYRDVKFLERRDNEEDQSATCSYCETPTQKEFCTSICERSAALAGLPLKFPKKANF
jgi:hypothetical protein